MKNQLASILLLFLSTSVFCQNNSGLLIEYNLYNDQITYIKNNEVVQTPSVKPNENINIIVHEFNPYITKATIRVDRINYNQSSSELATQDFAGGGGASSFSGIGNLLGGLSMGSDAGGGFSGIPGSRGVSSQEAMKAKSEFKSLTAELGTIENKINNAYQKLNLIQKSQKSKQLAVSDIGSLKVNPHIQPSRLKQLIQEEIQYAFAKLEGEEIDINDLVSELEIEHELNTAIKKYMDAKQEYESVYNKWNTYLIGLKLMGIADLDDQMEYIYNSSDTILSNLEDNIEKFKNIDIDDADIDIDPESHKLTMAQLRQVSEEIKSNNFKYSFSPIQADGDEVELEISFARKNEFGDYDKYKSLTQKIPVTGTWKISGGVGLCFGSFGKAQEKYTVSDNRIIADKMDEFIPVVASFAHFYKTSEKNLNLGGTFGIGLPLIGGDNIQSASFFIGPTALIGKNQRLLLSAGFMGAKTEQLSSAYNVGDSFTNAPELLPKTSSYKVGFFVGLSFAVLR